MATDKKAESTKGTEEYVVKKFVDLIRPLISKRDKRLTIETQIYVPYANHCRYLNEEKPKQKRFVVDILISENNVPRVIIECKKGTYTTHCIIDYSGKAEKHKTVFPHLRYGFLVLNAKEKKLTGRYYVHARNFDFADIFSKKYSKDMCKGFVDTIIAEVDKSRIIEKNIFG